MKPMITNGGPHPADKWADMTVDTILELVQVQEDSVSPEATAARAAKRALRPVLFNIFNAHHDRVQKHETGEIAKNAKRVHATLDPMPHATPVMAQVDAALAATPFAAHFAQPAVRSVIGNIVAQHTANVMHIERRWHADRLNTKVA